MTPELATLAHLLGVTEDFITHCRERMADQQVAIEALKATGQDTAEAERLRAVFGDVEQRFADYKRTLENEIAAIRGKAR